MKSKRIGYIDDSIRDLANDMIQTTLDWDHDSEFGAALAAIQIGEPLKLTVVRNDFDDAKSKEFTTLVNPEIVKTSPEQVSDVEGCLSVPGIYGRVKRPLKIKVKAQDIDGHPIRLTLEGFPARVLQHEIDHMNGIIFLDHVEDTSQLFNIDKNGSLMPVSQSKKDDLKKINKQ
jgi:peptide deformylase